MIASCWTVARSWALDGRRPASYRSFLRLSIMDVQRRIFVSYTILFNIELAWQDVSQNYAVSLVKFVLADYTCVRRFANYHCVHGDKAPSLQCVLWHVCAMSCHITPVSCQTSLGKMEQIAESVELLAGDKGPRFNSLRSLFLARAWVVHQSIWCQSGLSSTSMLATERGLSCFRWGIFSGWWARWAIVRTICQGDTFSYIWNVVTLLCQSCEVCIHIR